MDTFIYCLLGFAAFSSVFLLGWQVGCWFLQNDNKFDVTDRYAHTDKFYENYYDCEKNEYSPHHKSKKKKLNNKFKKH